MSTLATPISRALELLQRAEPARQLQALTTHSSGRVMVTYDTHMYVFDKPEELDTLLDYMERRDLLAAQAKKENA